MRINIQACEVRPGDRIETDDDTGMLIVRRTWSTAYGGMVAIVTEDEHGRTKRSYRERDAYVTVHREHSDVPAFDRSMFEEINVIGERANRLSASLRMWQVRDLPGAPDKAMHAARQSMDMIAAFTVELERLRLRLLAEDAAYQERQNAAMDDALAALADDFGGEKPEPPEAA